MAPVVEAPARRPTWRCRCGEEANFITRATCRVCADRAPGWVIRKIDGARKGASGLGDAHGKPAGREGARDSGDGHRPARGARHAAPPDAGRSASRRRSQRGRSASRKGGRRGKGSARAQSTASKEASSRDASEAVLTGGKPARLASYASLLVACKAAGRDDTELLDRIAFLPKRGEAAEAAAVCSKKGAQPAHVAVRILAQRIERAEKREKRGADELLLAQQELDKATAAQAASKVELAALRSELESARIRHAEESAAELTMAAGPMAAIAAALKLPANMAGRPLAAQLQPALVQLSEFMAQIFAASRQIEAEAAASAEAALAAAAHLASGDGAPFIEVLSKRRRKKASPAVGHTTAEVHAMSDGAGSGGPASSTDDEVSDAPMAEAPVPEGWVKLLGGADEALRPALLAEWRAACAVRPRPRQGKAARSKAAPSATAVR